MKISTVELNNGRAVMTCYIQEPSPEMASAAERPAILILPGGAYMFVSDRESEPIALAYAARGFQAFVLRYSVGEAAHGLKPMAEVTEAIAHIRENTSAYHANPGQLAVCGFSAGGHLAAWAGLCCEHKPDAMVLAYPVIDIGAMVNGPTHPVAEAVLGKGYRMEDVEQLNLSKHAVPGSIPMFCWHTFEDNVVPITQTTALVQAYAKAGAPFEYHVYQFGAHGLSLSVPETANGNAALDEPEARGWLDASARWLKRVLS